MVYDLFKTLRHSHMSHYDIKDYVSYKSIQDCLDRLPTMNIIPKNIRVGRFTFSVQNGWLPRNEQCILSILFAIKCTNELTKKSVYEFIEPKMKEFGIVYVIYDRDHFAIKCYPTDISNTYIRLFSLLAPIEITVNQLNMPTLLELCTNKLSEIDVLKILYDYHELNGSDAMLSLMNVLVDNGIHTKMTKDL